jgi:hypothetical protein
METVREFGRFDGVARDLRESPFPMELDQGRHRRVVAGPQRLFEFVFGTNRVF